MKIVTKPETESEIARVGVGVRVGAIALVTLLQTEIVIGSVTVLVTEPETLV